MKRDMDLCRKILLSVEAREGTVGPEEVEIEGYTEGQIGYHAKLLADQGLAGWADHTMPDVQRHLRVHATSLINGVRRHRQAS